MRNPESYRKQTIEQFKQLAKIIAEEVNIKQVEWKIDGNKKLIYYTDHDTLKIEVDLG